MAAAPPPQTFPYDHLFKLLIIGDAGVGKVCYDMCVLVLGVELESPLVPVMNHDVDSNLIQFCFVPSFHFPIDRFDSEMISIMKQ